MEIGWDDQGQADAPPSGFELHTDGTGKPAVRRIGAEVSLFAEPAKFCHLDCALPGSDGTDDAPLRVECSMSIDAPTAVVGSPLLMSLVWSSGALISVGLGDGGGDRSNRRWPNQAWSASVVAGKPQSGGSGLGIYTGAVPVHVRLVVATHTISAYASADGWSWTRINAWARSPELSGSPQKLIVGRGWTGAKPGLDNDITGTGALATYHLSHLQLSTRGAQVPAELMKRYEKKDSREETIDQIQASGLVKAWQILGPLGPNEAGYGFEGADPATPLPQVNHLKWKAFVPGESPTDRILLMHAINPGMGDDAVRYAESTITSQDAHIERFLFDGERDIAVFLNGVLLAQDWHDGPVQDDRLSATGWLRQGSNRLLVRLGAGHGGVALLTLHHYRGDLLYQIALQKRLAIDFPDDGDVNLQAAQDVARMWEYLGYQREAERAYEEMAKSPDASPEQIDAALMERARLDRELGDDDRVAADVEDMTKRWSDSADPATSQIKVAGLWQRMGMQDKAAAALAAAATLAAGNPQKLLDIAMQRACIHQALNDPAGVIGDLQSAVKALPEGDFRLSEMQVTLAQYQQRVGSDTSKLLSEALKGARPIDCRRIAALEAQRKDRAGEIAARQRSVAVSPQSLDAPGIALAKLLAQGGEFAPACEALQQAIQLTAGSETPEVQARLKGLPAKPEDRYRELQGIAVESWLRSSDDGSEIMRHVDEPKVVSNLPSEIPMWHVLAPILERPQRLPLLGRQLPDLGRRGARGHRLQQEDRGAVVEGRRHRFIQQRHPRP